jgi:hypothetical protein
MERTRKAKIRMCPILMMCEAYKSSFPEVNTYLLVDASQNFFVDSCRDMEQNTRAEISID